MRMKLWSLRKRLVVNNSESKYFRTAIRMDEAFLEILEKKDFAYITVKEVCQKAGVNRSTFYLHYETMNDLLSESITYMHQYFLESMHLQSEKIVIKLRDCPIEELYLVTPEYLLPYLEYIKSQKRLFQTAIENPEVLQLNNTYERMFQHVFTPILERFKVPSKDRTYIMAYHMQGLMAIVMEWLKKDCVDETIKKIEKDMK